MENSILMSSQEATVSDPHLDPLDCIGFWIFKAALLIVFVVWLARHVLHEIANFKDEYQKLRHQASTPPVETPSNASSP